MATTSHEEPPEPKAAEAPRAGATGGGASILRLLVRAVGLGALKREAAASARNAGIRFALRLVAVILWLLVAGFLLGALTVWLSGILGAIAACAVIAAVFAVIALVLHLVAAQMARRRKHWNLKAEFPGLAEALGNGTLNESAIGALAVAALAGFFLGMRGKR